LAGTALVTGGLAGTLAVGGNVAAGAAPTTNAVQIGGVDPTGLTRRVLLDPTGTVEVSGPAPVTGATAIAQKPIAAVLADVPLGQAGDSVYDLLRQTVQYLASIEFFLRQQPSYLNAGQSITDEFQQFRDDPSLFNN
jgi:hypothetical protein